MTSPGRKNLQSRTDPGVMQRSRQTHVPPGMHSHCSSAHSPQPEIVLHGVGQPSNAIGLHSELLHTFTQQSNDSQPSAHSAPM
jgi:hypothetical protein